MQPIHSSLGNALLSLALLAPMTSRAAAPEPATSDGTSTAVEPAFAAASPARAERVSPDEEVDAPVDTEPSAALPASEAPAAQQGESTAAPAEPVAAPEQEPFLRRVLAEAAAQERRQRFAEGLLGLTGAGALLGTGFAAEGPNMTASHWLWVSGGLVALGSLTTFFVPSSFEHFAGEAAKKSDAELRTRWKKLAEQARVERRAGAVLGTLVGGAAIALGVLTLEDQVWNLSDDARLILGTGMVSGGAFGVTKGVVDWFVPSSVERGFALVAPGPQLALSLAPSPRGFGVGLKGVFQ